MKEQRNCLTCSKLFPLTRRDKRCCSARCSVRKWMKENPNRERWSRKSIQSIKRKIERGEYQISREYLKATRRYKTYKEIAAATGFSYEWIRLLCTAYGFKKRPRVLTREILIEGLSRKSIEGAARELRCSKDTLRRRVVALQLRGAVQSKRKQVKRLAKIKAFWDSVDKNGPMPRNAPELGRCWLWIGKKFREGYGRLSNEYAQRMSYALNVGEIPKWHWVRHRCGNLLCVNPKHLHLREVRRVLRRVNRGGPC